MCVRLSKYVHIGEVYGVCDMSMLWGCVWYIPGVCIMHNVFGRCGIWVLWKCLLYGVCDL